MAHDYVVRDVAWSPKAFYMCVIWLSGPFSGYSIRCNSIGSWVSRAFGCMVALSIC